MYLGFFSKWISSLHKQKFKFPGNSFNSGSNVKWKPSTRIYLILAQLRLVIQSQRVDQEQFFFFIQQSKESIPSKLPPGKSQAAAIWTTDMETAYDLKVIKYWTTDSAI